MKKDNSKSAQQMTTVCKDSASEKDNKIEGEEDHVESIPNYSLPNGCTTFLMKEAPGPMSEFNGIWQEWISVRISLQNIFQWKFCSTLRNYFFHNIKYQMMRFIHVFKYA